MMLYVVLCCVILNLHTLFMSFCDMFYYFVMLYVVFDFCFYIFFLLFCIEMYAPGMYRYDVIYNVIST